MILGHDLIRKLGLDLKFNDNTPAIIWKDVEVPMVPHEHWTPAQINEAFATILELPLTLRQAETNFEEKSPTQQQAFWHIMKTTFHSIFRKAGKLTLQTSSSQTHHFWMQEGCIQQHLCPLLYDLINCKQLIVEIYKMTEVHVNLIGPWIILQRPFKSPKLSEKPDVTQPLQVLALSMINLSTNLLELIVVSDKESCTMAHAFDRSWLCHCPRPLICLQDRN
jgi:hypothetical protein